MFPLARANPENNAQVAAQRAGESYQDTQELEADAIRAATRATASFGMTLPEFFATEQEGSLPGQEDLPKESDCGRITLKLAIVEADPRILRSLQRRAVEEYLPRCRSRVARYDGAHSFLDPVGQIAM